MKKLEKLAKISLMFTIFTLTFASICVVKAQTPEENMKMFLDSKIPGIMVQVNATAETQPNQNITVMLSLKRQTSVYVEYLNLSIFGFLNGTEKIIMANITDNNFPLDDTPEIYNCTFKVPKQVWDVTYGEIALTYNVTYSVESGILIIIPYENLKIGFTMTHVENVYLESVEEQLKSLSSIYVQLNQTFWESFQMNLTMENLALLNRTYWELQQNYTALQGSLNELDNTRTAVTVLAITTVFFVATTVYMVMRKPKQYW
jgi:hypothetical protein